MHPQRVILLFNVTCGNQIRRTFLHKHYGIALVLSPIGSGKTELRLLNLCKISLFPPLGISAALFPALASPRCSSRSDASSFHSAEPRSRPRSHRALLKK